MIERDPATALPRLRLARLPTPLEPAPRLAEALGLGALWIKREDLAGVALGGNKLRQIDFILAAAMQAGADTIVTTASSQSNFCRAIAGSCAAMGMGCHLLLRRAGGTAVSGNLLLDQLFGAEIDWTEATDPWDPAIRAALDGIIDRLRAAGSCPYLVQLPGETAALAAAGWVSGAHELAADFAALGTVPDAVVVACGSGLTFAGLALGFRRAGLPTRVIGVSVQQPADRLRKWVLDVAERTTALLPPGAALRAEDIVLTDDQIPPGYGQPSPASIEAVRLAGRSGVLLDPVYSGKAMAGLRAAVRDGAVRRGGDVLFLHSGGLPGLFHHASAFA
jgi:1-aminocyclopropane-1-carboxylate deaminase/D-cysteine desulfhydrase-like pyridoxal-dependent ACC family enzyme